MIDLKKAGKALEAMQSLLDATPQAAAHVRIAPDAWTLAEITGHLIDSASNNHQRFARLRFGDLHGFPGYEAEPWVAAQRYDECDFSLLKALWASYNAMLLHLAATTPDHARTNAWHRESGPLTLEFLVADYYDHLMLHVEHYARRLREICPEE